MRSTTDDESARAATTATASAKIGTTSRTSSAWAHARPDSSATPGSYRAEAVSTSTHRPNRPPDQRCRALATYLTIAAAQFRPRYRARCPPARISDYRSSAARRCHHVCNGRCSAPTTSASGMRCLHVFAVTPGLYEHRDQAGALPPHPRWRERRPGPGPGAPVLSARTGDPPAPALAPEGDRRLPVSRTSSNLTTALRRS